jgi:phosphoenolpyruvate synthase/pyruvate phosphate dikinase
MKLTLNFKELNKGNTDIAGGKGASLGEMTQVGIPVPPGFVVLSTTFETFIKEADLAQEIDNIIDNVNHKDINSVETASEKIQALIKNASIPENIAKEIEEQFKLLDTEYVAVRSSATAEDGADNAWAGQLDSYLNTKKENLLEKVQHCWASLFTPRAIFYRFEKGLHTTKISVAVVVQKMVNSEISGIAFSVHPVTEDRNQMIIEAGFGLGEAIVSGQVTPDSYVVEKELRRIIDINVNTQARGLYRVQTGGNEWIDILEPKASSQVLTDSQVLEFADLIMRIENHYGFPCDIEWAYEKNVFYIVQSRPITTLSNKGYNQVKEKTLYEKYIETLNGNEPFTFSGPFSGLFTAIPWSNNKYYNKYYKTSPFYFLYIGEGRKSTETVDNTKYKLYAKEVFENFVSSKITLEELENNFNSLSEEIKNLYNKKISDPTESVSKAFDLMNHLIASTVYIETFDKHIIEDVLNIKIGNEEWEKATVLNFDSFETRWNKKINDTKNIDEIQYIFTDYYFIKNTDQIKEELKKRNIEIKNNKNNIEILDYPWVKYTQFVMKMRDFRKDPIAMLHTIIAKSAQILYPTATVDEVANLNCLEVIENKLPTVEELRKRQNGYVVLIKPDLTYEISYDQFEETKRKINSVDNFNGDLKGVSAMRGIVKGIVRVILDPTNYNDFKDGDILVTSMTRPDFVPIMKKAGAVITNEGGITCHAAIISRELNIPCIIGTKIATKVLKDGDMVEVDADNGIVKIIK